MTRISEQVEKISGTFIDLYLAQMESLGELRESAKILREIFTFQNEDHSYTEHAQLIKKFHDGQELSPESIKEHPNFGRAIAEYGKIQDMLRRIRNITNEEYYEEAMRDESADSWTYVLNRLEQQDVEASEVQKLLDHVKISTSTTSHPTNPTSVEYTKSAMALSEILVKLTSRDVEPRQAHDEINAGIARLIATPLTEKKKTQRQEVAEGLLYLDAEYDLVAQVFDDFERKISANEKYRDLKLPDNFYAPCVWITGDGDGNPNSNEETLRYNIAEFRRRIRERYSADIEKIIAETQEGSALKGNLAIILVNLKDPNYSLESFKEELSKTVARANPEEKRSLETLQKRVNIFGFHYAKIDIRHESTDLMKTALGLLVAVGALPAIKDLDKLKLEDVKALYATHEAAIKDAFNNPEILARIRALETSGVKSELTRRIFGRLRAIAENPDMSDKMIIAEFKGAANAEATLFLLKATGNEVGNERAKMNIVPLAEEVDTLRALPADINAILHNDEYWAHVHATKQVYFMIAKSDTVRRDGIGAQFYQEKAVQDSIAQILRVLIEKDLKHLEDYVIHPYNGGGHALQRGGGRLSELPSVYGRYALKAIQQLKEEYKDRPDVLAKLKTASIDAPCFTVQGHQNGILLHPFTVGAGTLSALASQALYAEARLRGDLVDLEVEPRPGEDKDALRDRATQARQICCDKAIGAYAAIKDGTGSINRLFSEACWIAIKLNNKSSRASVRGIGDGGIEEGTTFAQIKGEGNKMLDQRAIGAEKLNSHSGLHLISWFSIKEGLEETKKAGFNLHEMFRGSKATRDAMRGIATSLFMVDFSISWPMMCDGKDRPGKDEIDALYQRYMQKVEAEKEDEISPQETLAFIEIQHRETLKLVYETIYSRAPEPDVDVKKEILRKWPEMQAEIEDRERRNRFSHVLEAELTHMSNKNPQAAPNNETIKLVESCYCAADVTNAPLGILLGLTKDRSMSRETSELSPDATPEGSTNICSAFGKIAQLQPGLRFSPASGLGRLQEGAAAAVASV